MKRRGHGFHHAEDIEKAQKGRAPVTLAAFPFAQGMNRDAQIIGNLSRGQIEPRAKISKAQAKRRAGIFWGLGFHLKSSKKAREIVPGLRE